MFKLSKKSQMFGVVLGLIILVVVVILIFSFFGDIKGILGGWNVDLMCTLTSFLSSHSNSLGKPTFSIKCTPDYVKYSPGMRVKGVIIPNEIIDHYKNDGSRLTQAEAEYLLAYEIKRCWYKMGSGHFNGLFSNWFYRTGPGFWSYFTGIKNIFTGINYCSTCAIIIPEKFSNADSITYADFYNFTKTFHFYGSKKTIYDELSSNFNFEINPYSLKCGDFKGKSIFFNQPIYVMFIKHNQNYLLGMSRVVPATRLGVLQLGNQINVLLGDNYNENFEKTVLAKELINCTEQCPVIRSNVFGSDFTPLKNNLSKGVYYYNYYFTDKYRDFFKRIDTKVDQIPLKLTSPRTSCGDDQVKACVEFTHAYWAYMRQSKYLYDIKTVDPFKAVSTVYNFFSGTMVSTLDNNLAVSGGTPITKENYEDNVNKIKDGMIKSAAYQLAGDIDFLEKLCKSQKSYVDNLLKSSVKCTNVKLNCNLWDITRSEYTGYSECFKDALTNKLLNGDGVSEGVKDFFITFIYNEMDNTDRYGIYDLAYKYRLKLNQLISEGVKRSNPDLCNMLKWGYLTEKNEHLVSLNGLVPSISGTIFGNFDVIKDNCQVYVAP